MSQKIELLTIPETERFILDKLMDIETQGALTDQGLMRRCSPKELWQSDPVWKYYKNPKNKNRSTKNFDNKNDAYARLSEDGSVGVVVEVPGEVKYCPYCPAIGACEQADQMVQSGLLKI